ncbi:hypothetical protein [Mycobacteroides abscessus]|uniref:hypothetical protein n=2 Tax=Mycobacteroides abscessus TaxID=36809 RepID=UPI000929125F|nr:hypothetical protein [Mycobacteroides abscessus]MBE5502600.1 hypothetical protein [Mycobacteroides abscessus]MDO2987005.1 hypothetical protein [Mycobacteroides abscessus subsp. abscessus]SIA19986.1 Uncharacterised protein [Mycobacteroides abscessus subsp. abscessus]SID30371.1 Uncharacterised protein [Mycobacteroides abscessus subsp. abscessus]SIJ91279.1 Uncharacterised protein [Mycobacteroides abscessus subsp. abscessus]
MSNSNIVPINSPKGFCARDGKTQARWQKYDIHLQKVISVRASDSRKVEAAEPMIRYFCDRCPIKKACELFAATGKQYTGIAGGKLFKDGVVTLELGANEPAAQSA